MAAFGCYFCMYGFRRPFTAATYLDTPVADFKTVLVTSQVLGYMLAKFVGIKIVAEMPPERRAIALLAQILAAEATLVLFALIPPPWNAACLFLNGLSLGMVFGLVLGFLEGRRVTEMLVAGLCASFILADGVTKSVGAWLLAQGVTELWMPAVAGLLFLAPLVLFVAMLARVPAPGAADVAARAPREAMTRAERWAFVRRHAPGLLPLVLMYLGVTIVRSIRADFAPEIWRELGTEAVPGTFTRSELWVALGVLVLNGSAILITDSRRAFFVSLATCGLGFGLLVAALAALRAEALSSFAFMVLLGFGLYLPYVAVHTTVFERLLAVTRDRGNLGFLMYFADSIGYLGYVVVMVISRFGIAPAGVLKLLLGAGWVVAGVSVLCLVQSASYFARAGARRAPAIAVEEVG
ncbi:MAG: hypothetical protein JNG90_13695 [Planctomycetaceae bacterium]|nr:hypothetical protein [Planctomycetaceae bacterium]